MDELDEGNIYGRRPLVEDNLEWKTIFSEKQPLVEDDLQWKTTFDGSLHAANFALWHIFYNNQIDSQFLKFKHFQYS